MASITSNAVKKCRHDLTGSWWLILSVGCKSKTCVFRGLLLKYFLCCRQSSSPANVCMDKLQKYSLFRSEWGTLRICIWILLNFMKMYPNTDFDTSQVYSIQILSDIGIFFPPFTKFYTRVNRRACSISTSLLPSFYMFCLVKVV